MRMFSSLVALALCAPAFAGVGYTEEDLMEMADVIIEGHVASAACVSATEASESMTSTYTATIVVDTVTKGDDLPSEITLQSTVVEWTGEDQPACSDNDSIHPEGEVARYYLMALTEPGHYKDAHWSSTISLAGSTPVAAPECAAGDIKDDPNDPPKGCATVAAPSIGGFLLAMLFGWTRRRRPVR